jgi:hypothetical protein
MFLEYNGKLYLSPPQMNVTIEEMWFAAKNNLSIADPYVKLWSTNVKYKCKYEKPIMDQIDKYAKNIYTVNK